MADLRCHLMDGYEICDETKQKCDFANPYDMEEYMNFCKHYNDYMGR